MMSSRIRRKTARCSGANCNKRVQTLKLCKTHSWGRLCPHLEKAGVVLHQSVRPLLKYAAHAKEFFKNSVTTTKPIYLVQVVFSTC
ncbi:hypothetical protein PHMEG_0007269 [Phytophthora megakarya]|uniref:Uncharacterized protein n=1 Tax=Phytophthora megakarya TaxID=4795 RepID=A0A225WM97_9STRA|nr:hypothetical protein PHMEG_0007269 [Phytophthora megakarya]